MLLVNKHIFLIEDNVTNAAIALTTLQMAGATTYFDRWGTHTVLRMKTLPTIDLILMDLHLQGGITGYDVFDRIQADPDLAKIPTVVISASDATIELNKARKKGFVGYIQKPIDFATFSKLIASILEGKEVWADDF